MKLNLLSSLNTSGFFPKILVSTIILYFYKTAFWPLTYLFIISYVIMIFVFLMNFDGKFKVKGFLRIYLVPLILAGIFILSFVISYDFTISIVKNDILLIAVLFSLFYFIHWNINSNKKVIPVSFGFNFIIALTTVISILNLANQIFPSIFSIQFHNRFNIPNGSTIAGDYNFFSLFLLFGLILINTKKKNGIKENLKFRISDILLGILFIINILLSGSRRAFLILIILTAIYILYSVISKGKNLNTVIFIKSTIYLILSGIILIFFVYITFRNLPKQNISELAKRYSLLTGIENLRLTEKFSWKREPEIPVDKHHLIDQSSFNINNKYWTSNAIGTSITYLNTCFGKSIQVSRGKGDSGSFSLQFIGPKILYYANHTYKISFKIKFDKGDFKSFNLGWWINDGNKGYANAASLEKEVEPLSDGWYSCISKYTFIDNHYGLAGFFNSVADSTSFIISDFELIDLDYDPKLPRYVFEVNDNENLDIWLAKNNSPFFGQNLLNNGNFKSGLAFWKCTSQAAINLKVENIDAYNCVFVTRGNGNGGDWSLFYVGRPIEYKANNEYQIAFKMKPVNSKTIPFNVGFWVDEGEGYQIGLKLKIDTIEDGWLDIKAKYIFKKNHTNLLFPINSQIDNSQFYITDISLVNLTQTQFQIEPNKFTTDTLKKEALFSDRISRWNYALVLWESEYKWYNKLFGHGFDYLEWYGKKFIPNNTGKSYDWPHNPFISVLLYSGIIGFIAYLWLLWKVISLYIIYRKDYAIAFIGFLITFFFSFFSGSSPFDPPIMGFFMLLPFFIHSIHKNEPPKLTVTLTDDKNSNNRD